MAIGAGMFEDLHPVWASEVHATPGMEDQAGTDAKVKEVRR